LNNTNNNNEINFNIDNTIKTIEEESEDISYDLINYFLDKHLNHKEKNKLKHLELNYDKMILSQTQRKTKKRRNKI